MGLGHFGGSEGKEASSAVSIGHGGQPEVCPGAAIMPVCPWAGREGECNPSCLHTRRSP